MRDRVSKLLLTLSLTLLVVAGIGRTAPHGGPSLQNEFLRTEFVTTLVFS